MSRIPIASLANGVLFATQTFSSPANPSGVPVLTPAVGVQAFVYVHDTATPASIWTDELGSTPLVQPLTTDATGTVPGWIDTSLLPLDLIVALPSGNETFVLAGGVSGGGGGGGVDSIFGRTGSITAQVGDYTAGQVGADVVGAAAAVAASVTTETARAQSAEALKAPLASPAFTGTPTAPTQAALDNSTKLATTAYVDSAVGAQLGGSNGTDDTAAINAALLAGAGGIVRGKPGASYKTTAPLVVPSNTTLDMTSCHITLQPASNCPILINNARNLELDLTDATIASGAKSTLTSASGKFTNQMVGWNVIVAGAGVAGAALQTTISAFNSATSVQLTTAATAGVTGVVAVLNPRDSNITLKGGSWDFGTSAQGVESELMFMFLMRHIDGLTIRDMPLVAAASGKDLIAPADCTNVFIENITFAGASPIGNSGVQLDGPITGFYVGNIYGYTTDDFVALVCSDWLDVGGTFQGGNITNGLVDGLYPTDTRECVVKLIGGANGPFGQSTIQNVTVRKVSGSCRQSAMRLYGDPNTGGITILEGVTIESVDTQLNTAGTNFLIDCSVEQMTNVTFRDLHLDANQVGAKPTATVLNLRKGQNTQSIHDVVTVENVSIHGAATTGNLVALGTGVFVKQMFARGLRAATDTTLTTVNGVALTSSAVISRLWVTDYAILGTTATVVSVGTGSILTLSKISNGWRQGAGSLVSYAGNNGSGSPIIQVVDVEDVNASSVFTFTGTTTQATTLLLTNVKATGVTTAIVRQQQAGGSVRVIASEISGSTTSVPTVKNDGTAGATVSITGDSSTFADVTALTPVDQDTVNGTDGLGVAVWHTGIGWRRPFSTNVPQTVRVDCGTFTASQTKDIAVTWPVAFSDGNYTVSAVLVDTGSTANANAIRQLVGAPTTTGCTIRVAGGTVGYASAGVLFLHVTAIHD